MSHLKGQENVSYLFLLKVNFCHIVKNDDKITHTETECKSSFITQKGMCLVPQQLLEEKVKVST